MERKVVATLALLILSGLMLTGYAFVEPRRQEEALARQERIGIHRGIENYTTLCMSCHGVDGNGAHTLHEHLFISSLVPRMTLQKRLMESLA